MDNTYKERNYFYIRVGKYYVVPLLLILHDHKQFTEYQFHELITATQNILCKHIMSLHGNYQNTLLTVEQSTLSKLYCLTDFSFNYKFTPTFPKYCIFVKSEAFLKSKNVIDIDKIKKKRNNNNSDEDVVVIDDDDSEVDFNELEQEQEIDDMNNKNRKKFSFTQLPLPKPEEIIETKYDKEIEQAEQAEQQQKQTELRPKSDKKKGYKEKIQSVAEYNGGEYDGLTVTGHTLVIETFPKSTYNTLEAFHLKNSDFVLPDNDSDYNNNNNSTTAKISKTKDTLNISSFFGSNASKKTTTTTTTKKKKKNKKRG
ncbi:hypothetical protein DLAC_11688 [Tieghemostelium lacteum]|uniref:Uncharacterized protein n=1 Tax=Tieghemostelium lacteum TaxID=361077 RepID=A0A151ZCJ8_TIELA|nr:hypothetical protein DLAC_11688 [Tieghemostelium lacteum]|eukprot:KYQ91661.1 hypothetical protein DLAC_11688 [Tieghemostelium lacteum]